MDARRFDALVASLGESEASRRSILTRLFGGWLAAGLAFLGIGGLAVEDAEAKKKGGGKKARKRCKRGRTGACRRCCNKRKRSKRNRCLSRKGCTGAGRDNSTPITFDIDLLNTPCTVGGSECGTGTGLECVAGLCLPVDQGDTCQKDSDCSSGQCNENSNKCVACTEVCGDPGDEVCCSAGAECAGGECVVS